jgi:hypothetical protein
VSGANEPMPHAGDSNNIDGSLLHDVYVNLFNDTITQPCSKGQKTLEGSKIFWPYRNGEIWN